HSPAATPTYRGALRRADPGPRAVARFTAADMAIRAEVMARARGRPSRSTPRDCSTSPRTTSIEDHFYVEAVDLGANPVRDGTPGEYPARRPRAVRTGRPLAAYAAPNDQAGRCFRLTSYFVASVSHESEVSSMRLPSSVTDGVPKRLAPGARTDGSLPTRAVSALIAVVCLPLVTHWAKLAGAPTSWPFAISSWSLNPADPSSSGCSAKSFAW